MTGRWELALDQITDGRQDADRFMDSIRKFSTFLVNFARNNRADVVFPDDGHRKKRTQSFVTRGTKIDGCVCPVCRKGGVLESPQAFFCSRAADGCHFTLWKDCLTRGGGPMLTEKLLRLLLEKQVVRGSTGAITLLDGAISFFPNESDRASAYRPLTYEKKHR